MKKYLMIDLAATVMLLIITGCGMPNSDNNKTNTQRHPIEPEMVFVQGGTFLMGCASEQGEVCFKNEKPEHEVRVSDFYIGKYEITQAQWEALMGSTVRQQRNKFKFLSSLRGEGDKYPMYYVSWEEAQMFIERLNKATNKQYRLPTEAEWEYAARGGNQSKGYKYSGSNFIENIAWTVENSNKTTHPVGTKKANELGIFDMSGNVLEWCYDRYGNYPDSMQNNPMGANTLSESYRVCRGGVWINRHDYDYRVTCRNFKEPNFRSNKLGFRLAYSSEDENNN
jgi:formylglycine-generating enzyme required for sulfatase activity